jgi:hypothetical protein
MTANYSYFSMCHVFYIGSREHELSLRTHVKIQQNGDLKTFISHCFGGLDSKDLDSG